jgi:hypothetical protein
LVHGVAIHADTFAQDPMLVIAAFSLASTRHSADCEFIYNALGGLLDNSASQDNQR